MKKRTIFMVLIFFSIITTSFSAQVQRQKRIRFESEKIEIFTLLGIKVSKEIEKNTSIDFFFNKTLNPESVYTAKLFINDNPIQKQSIHFSKNGKRFRINIKSLEENSTLKIEGIKSSNDESIKSIVIENICENSFFRFNRRGEVWRKFKNQ